LANIIRYYTNEVHLRGLINEKLRLLNPRRWVLSV